VLLLSPAYFEVPLTLTSRCTSEVLMGNFAVNMRFR
jgi:hypothetical protein